MNSQVKPLRLKLSRQELVNLCKDVMVSAAQDLAYFTQEGIYANKIVALALKCEEFEKLLQNSAQPSQASQFKRLEKEIRMSLVEICDMGKRIWANNPEKFKDYVLPGDFNENYPGSTNVA